MHNALAISLGHNSSAVLIQDGAVVAGYEEERFTKKKADSEFPLRSIQKLKDSYSLPKDTDIYVGHWFLDANLPSPNKYWQPEAIRYFFPDGDIHSLSADFTHHDSHLESAMVFAHPFRSRYTAVVADGFGSYGEVISIYEVEGKSFSLKQRVFGFDRSLGMLYQYATAFMGMQMHNHEYKMLAYEVHVHEVLDNVGQSILEDLIREQASKYIKECHKFKLGSKFDPIMSLTALPETQNSINLMLQHVLETLQVDQSNTWTKRIVISRFVQGVVELTMMTLVTLHNPTNLLVVGGLFYNVKLNHLLAQMIPGGFCAMPLAGDQGAALGVYNAYEGNLKWPEHLFWGDRELSQGDEVSGISYARSDDEVIDMAMNAIHSKGFVNLVRGKMEYGPRALCNTSTLAIPDISVTEKINKMNDRTAEMPMAPVMNQAQANDIFVDCHKIHKSLEYMIVTRSYQANEAEQMLGAAHWYENYQVFTGRPQITRDPVMLTLLEEFGPLVNTSFNYHGVPIVNGMDDVMYSHWKQTDNADSEYKPTTIVQVNK